MTAFALCVIAAILFVKFWPETAKLAGKGALYAAGVLAASAIALSLMIWIQAEASAGNRWVSLPAAGILATLLVPLFAFIFGYERFSMLALKVAAAAAVLTISLTETAWLLAHPGCHLIYGCRPSIASSELPAVVTPGSTADNVKRSLEGLSDAELIALWNQHQTASKPKSGE